MFYDGKDSDAEWNGGQAICKSYGVTKQLVEIVYFQLHKPFSLFSMFIKLIWLFKP